MKSTLYLHMGMPKTGTSAIQAFLHNNMKALKEKGCKYPYFEYSFPHISKNRNGHFLVSNTYNAEWAEDCFSQIFKFAEKFPKIVLTDEEIWSVDSHTPEFWINLKNRLNNEDIGLKVIVYLRRQDAFMASIWAQRVKYKQMRTCTFKQYMKNHKNRLDYYEAINEIAEVIGEENIIVRPYEFSQFKGNGNTLISDCLLAMGIEFDDSFVYDNSRRNLSIEGNVLEVKRFLNFIPEFKAKGVNFRIPLEAVQKHLMESGEFRNCSTFLAGERAEFMKQFREGNALLAKKYLGREDGVFFEAPLPENDPPKKDYKVKELKKILEMVEEAVKNDSKSPFTPEEFHLIAEKTLKLIKEKKKRKD